MGETREWRRQRIAYFVTDYYARHGVGPTMREIADAVGYASTAGVHRHLEILAARGELDRRPYTRRAYQPAGWDG